MSPGFARAEVRRRLALPAEKIFAAFADPELVTQWLRPSPDVLLTVLELESARAAHIASPTTCRTERACS